MNRPPRGSARPALTLRIHGPRAGRIRVAELLHIAGYAQTVVNRQAEVLEGRTQTLRPGPPIGRVRAECELELVSIKAGSTRLGFGLASPQESLPSVLTLGRDAIIAVGESIESAGRGHLAHVDSGVLHSLRHLASVLDGQVTSIEWLAPAVGRGRARRPGVSAVLNRRTKANLDRHSKAPKSDRVVKDGVLEMADFRPDEFKCRLRPALGPAVICTFDASRAAEIQAALRHPVRIEGDALLHPETGKLEEIHLDTIVTLDSLDLDAGSFFAHPTFEQLARHQGARPLRRAAELGGVLPDDFDVDEMVADIYRQRV